MLKIIRYNKILSFGGVVAGLVLIPGCLSNDPEKGYTTASLYRSDIQTVCVEMIQSESFRRGAEFNLTKAVVDQLELHSPYKVVSDRGQADTLLYGTIRQIREQTLTNQRELDRPLENELVLVVDVTWKDLRSGDVYLDALPIRIGADYAVLAGAGRGSATRRAVEDAAVRIVEAMEKSW